MSSQMFPSQEKLDYFCFLIFLCFCVVCGLYVWFNVPETKNRTALEIAAEFRKMHSKPGEPQREINTKQEVIKTQTNETKITKVILLSVIRKGTCHQSSGRSRVLINHPAVAQHFCFSQVVIDSSSSTQSQIVC